MSKLKYVLLTLGLMFGLGLAVIPTGVGAADPFADACDGTASQSALCKDLDNSKKAPEFIKDLVNMLLYVLGAVSIVVIIFAGIFYTTSVGDQNMVTKAKNTLLYAVVGLIVAVSAYAIVNYVLNIF